MLRRAVILLFALIAIATFSYAQSRNSPYTHPGQTNYTYLGLGGSGALGNPGYIELRATPDNPSNSTDATETYYLWIDETGDLCLASYTAISAFSSFPSGDWRSHSAAIGTAPASTFVCTKVGGQS